MQHEHRTSGILPVRKLSDTANWLKFPIAAMEGKLPVKLLLFCMDTVEVDLRARMQICVTPECHVPGAQGLVSSQARALTMIRAPRDMWLLNHTAGMVP